MAAGAGTIKADEEAPEGAPSLDQGGSLGLTPDRPAGSRDVQSAGAVAAQHATQFNTYVRSSRRHISQEGVKNASPARWRGLYGAIQPQAGLPAIRAKEWLSNEPTRKEYVYLNRGCRFRQASIALAPGRQDLRHS